MGKQAAGVAVLGAGVIGGEVARRIVSSEEGTTDGCGVELRLVGVLDRDADQARRAGIDVELVTSDGPGLVDDPNVNVVVEVLGGEQPAADLMCRALVAGKHVVTANKEAVSKHLPELLAAARAGNAGFYCEASVGGGIPLLVSLRQILANNRVERVRGIVNGTTNFILYQMDAHGCGYDDALAEAQRLGYAERDPTADVEGYDASYKLAILASFMAGRHIHPNEIDRAGISQLRADDVQEARERGGTIRLIAEAHLNGGGSFKTLSVAPAFVPNEDLFSRVVANYNAVEIVGDFVGPVWLHGQGAGPKPTSSAVLSDVVEAVKTGPVGTPVLSRRVLMAGL